jgi:hypothetical protein
LNPWAILEESMPSNRKKIIMQIWLVWISLKLSILSAGLFLKGIENAGEFESKHLYIFLDFPTYS